MIGRRVREWPRLVAAVVAAAVALVLIGVLVASASSGGTKTISARPAASLHAAPAPGVSNADKLQIAQLRGELKRESTKLAATRRALGASQVRTRCWRTKATHPNKERDIRCPTGSLSP